MGLLDKNITITFLEGKVPLQDLFEVIKEKLGDKYKVEFIKKGNAAAQFLGTSASEDRIFVAKNAYHRTFITVKHAPMTEDMSREDTYLGFDRSTMKWWLKGLYNEGGMIGRWIIQTIYGSNLDFDGDILEAINSKPCTTKRPKCRYLCPLEKKQIKIPYLYEEIHPFSSSCLGS